MATLTLEPVGVESWIDPTTTIAALYDAEALELITRDVPAGDDPSTAALTSLAQWLLDQASWYRSLEDLETAELAAETLEQAAQAAVFCRALTPRQLVARGARYRRHINLDRVDIPDERRSPLAELLEVDASDWLLRDNDTHRLVAALLLQRADEAHALAARTAAEYYELRAAFEQDAMDAQ